MKKNNLKIPKNIFNENSKYFSEKNIKENNMVNIWIFKRGNIEISERLSKKILPKGNGVIPYPLPFAKHVKVKNLINDIGSNNLSNLEETKLLEKIKEIGLKTISELTFYENFVLGIFINSFWKNKNLVIPLTKKMTKNEFENIKNIKFNQIYTSENPDFFSSLNSTTYILTPAGCFLKKEKNTRQIELHETLTSISPKEYLDKNVFLWSSKPQKNGWKIKTDKDSCDMIKKIDDFVNFKKIEMNL
tara:strand:- start:1319 stop:2056 length:738 start_codon:yes stop_codon:yes gene_type:complete